VTTDEDEDMEFERGIDIHVSLPQKKVKELGMLSGGERSLTSIALLFAMSQVNPPPFLVSRTKLTQHSMKQILEGMAI
jgi:chromosome segregation protein